jgi:hypothetical protein
MTSPVLFAISSAVLLTSCSATPSVTGPLSPRDIRAITLLVESRSDVRKPIVSIVADTSDHARVESGRSAKVAELANVFTVTRRRGRWTINESSIKDQYVVLTSER